MRREAFAAVFKSGRMHPTLSFHGYSLDLSRLNREAEADAAPGELPVEIVPVKIEPKHKAKFGTVAERVGFKVESAPVVLEKDAGLALARFAKPVKATKAIARTKRPPKESPDELAKVMRTCVKEFNRRIRRRDDRQGVFTCISCGEVFRSDEMEAGHYERRGHERLRFDPRNVHGQCHHCNCVLGGNKAAYRVGLIAKIGLAEVEQIETMKGAGGRLRLHEAHELLRDIMSGKLGI